MTHHYERYKKKIKGTTGNANVLLLTNLVLAFSGKDHGNIVFFWHALRAFSIRCMQFGCDVSKRPKSHQR